MCLGSVGAPLNGDEPRFRVGSELAPRSATRSKFSSPGFTIIRIIPAIESELKPRKTFRNPMVLALELAEELKRDGISRAELARRHGMSRARVTQKLNLLNLPLDLLLEIEAMGDYWERRLVTERALRNHTSVASKPANLSYRYRS